MKVDLTKLINNNILSLIIDSDVLIPEKLLTNSLIDKLDNVHLSGKITVNEEDEFVLTGDITGIMTLKDDLTLESVEYKFDGEIEENLDKFQNILDITDVLWQNILVEVPSKVHKNAFDGDYLSGEGWRVISEETYEQEKNNNNPFANLNELLNKKEEK